MSGTASLSPRPPVLVRLGPAVVLLTAVATAHGLAVGMERWTYDTWGALLVLPALLALSVPLVARARRAESDAFVRQLIPVALALKLLGVGAFSLVVHLAYDGTADATTYAGEAVRLAPMLRERAFGDVGPLVGTNGMALLGAAVFNLTGPTLLGGALVLGWLAFWGLWLTYRAAVIAVPGLDRRRAALLLLCLPSLLLWTGSFGKEAWMALALGLFALGSARLLQGLRGGVLLVVLGLAACCLIRPHVAAIGVTALALTYLFGRSRSLGRRLAVGVLLAGALVLVVRTTADFVGLDEVDRAGVEQTLDDVREQTAGYEGSQFAAPEVRTPLDLPWATASVLFRPLPWEAHSPLQLLAAVEGLALLVLSIRALPALAAALRRTRAAPFPLFALAFVLLFAYAFSTFGNFGLVVRERVQAVPFLLVLLALPCPPRRVPRVPAAPGALAPVGAP